MVCFNFTLGLKFLNQVYGRHVKLVSTVNFWTDDLFIIAYRLEQLCSLPSTS